MKKIFLPLMTLFFFLPLAASNPAALDTSFNQTGQEDTIPGTATFTISGTSQAYANAIAIDAFERSIIAGYAISSSTSETNVMLARFLTDGSIDTDFATNGYTQVIPSGSTYSTVNSVALDSSGRIIITGYATVSGVNKILVARFTTDGDLDATFNTSGSPAGTAIISLSGTSTSRAWGVALQPNDDIVITGDYNNNAGIFVARILGSGSSAGTLDTSFNITGFNTTLQAGITSRGYAVGLQLNGNILVTGYTTISSAQQIIIGCFKSNGVLNNSIANLTTPYGTNGQGWTTTSITNGAYAQCITVKADGTATVGGGLQTSSQTPIASIVAQFTPTGAFDTDFGNDGITTTQIMSSSTPATASSYIAGIKTEIDGTLIGTGSTTYQGSSRVDTFFIRYTAAGELDTTFTENGYLLTSINLGSEALGLALQSDTKPVGAGFSNVAGVLQPILIRILPGSSTNTYNHMLNVYGYDADFLSSFLYQNFYASIITDTSAQNATLESINTILSNYIAAYANQPTFNYVNYLYLLEPEFNEAQVELINSYAGSEEEINLFFSYLNARLTTLLGSENQS